MVESDIILAQTTTPVSARSGTKSAGGEWMKASVVEEILERLGPGTARHVARAPGRLNIMGGLGEYTGSLVLSKTIAEHVYVGVQPRDDEKIAIAFARSLPQDRQTPTLIGLSRLYNDTGTPIDAKAGRQLVKESTMQTLRCVLGAVVEFLRSDSTGRLEGGLSLVIGSTLDDFSDVGRESALAVATMGAVASSLGVQLDAVVAAGACQRVVNDWLDVPIGPADSMSALCGEHESLCQVRCDPCTAAGTLTIPDDLCILGVDCGTVLPDAGEKFSRVRAAAFMGRSLVDRIVAHEGNGRMPWDGYLSRISITDYVDRYRDRIPTKMKGQEYLDRFGETGDPLTRIDPKLVYKIRSRTEHHIYEHARAIHLVEGLARAIRTKQPQAFLEVGELMYASHWSYGQRCGLGAIESDLLVNLIRKHGTDHGVFGAKASGRGCGGCVAVLMKNTDAAHASIASAISEYQTKSKHKAKILQGYSNGVMVGGVHRV